MALFDRSLLNDGVRGREVLAWSSYDFANSGYTTVVITAVFNAYFVGVVAGGEDWGTLAWTLALSASYLLVIASAPLLGAWADLTARKKAALAASISERLHRVLHYSGFGRLYFEVSNTS